MRDDYVEENIKKRAYLFYEHRIYFGGIGNQFNDWQDARNSLGLWHWRVKDIAWYVYCGRLASNEPGSAETDWFTAERNLVAEVLWREQRIAERHMTEQRKTLEQTVKNARQLSKVH